MRAMDVCVRVFYLHLSTDNAGSRMSAYIGQVRQTLACMNRLSATDTKANSHEADTVFEQTMRSDLLEQNSKPEVLTKR